MMYAVYVSQQQLEHIFNRKPRNSYQQENTSTTNGYTQTTGLVKEQESALIYWTQRFINVTACHF